MHQRANRPLSLLLAFLLVLGGLPISTLATPQVEYVEHYESINLGAPLAELHPKPRGLEAASTSEVVADNPLRAFADAITEPVGVIGFENGFDADPNEIVEVIVHFRTLPSVLLRLLHEEEQPNFAQFSAEPLSDSDFEPTAQAGPNQCLDKQASLMNSSSTILPGAAGPAPALSWP